MPTEDDDRPQHRLMRKLSYRHKSAVTQSMQLPPRPKYSDDDDEQDASAPAGGVPINMNQSIFQMLTATRSNPRMGSRFDEQSDISEDEGEDSLPPSEKPLPTLEAIMEARGTQAGDEGDEGELASSRGPAPVMSQMLQAEAQMNMEDVSEEDRATIVGIQEEDENEPKSSKLAKRLMEIFNLPEMENVVSEYPCWLLKSVLLQGYMYITTRHICFYAYLPRKTDVATKSGSLSKRGKSNVKFTRYWFILKGDVLSYFSNQKDLYFPNGYIDLRYGIQANLVDSKDKEPTAFTLQTDTKKYYFRADSASNAKEWVKALQKVIFRTHNEGDSVKISIPIENVIDVDQSPVLEFADTIKLKAFDNDDTFAIDEYFFSFFSFGNDALKVLQSVTENSAASHIPEHLLRGSRSPSPSASSQEFATASATPALGNIRDTMSSNSPHSPSRSITGGSRPSAEYARASVDLSSRRSSDFSREVLKRATEPAQRSVGASRSSKLGDSVPTDFSLAESSLGYSSDDNTNPSASNILSGSDVFRSPTVGGMHRRSSIKERKEEKDSSDVQAFGRPSRRRTTGDMKLGKNAVTSDSEGEPSGQNRSGLNSPRLQDIAKERAVGWADWMKQRSKKMSNLLPSDPMGYIEKVSDMWTGGRKHYRDSTEAVSDEPAAEDDEVTQEVDNRFRTRFALSGQDKLIAVYFAYLHRLLPLYGKIYISNRHFCFRSILPGTKTKMIVPLKDIENVTREKGFRFGYSGLVITIRGYPEVFFEFGQMASRDDCAATVTRNVHTLKSMPGDSLSKQEKDGIEAAQKEYQMLQDAREDGYNEHELELPAQVEASGISDQPAIVFDDPLGSILNFKPADPMNITCLTIGSRGDVQPFVALCIGLQKDGHKCKIATHAEFRGFVEEHGIEFAEVAGDPGVLMDLCVQYGMFTYEFLKEGNSKMRAWLDDLLATSWKACQGSDLLIESPSVMAGIHIAEALGIPYFRAFTMPWTRTRAYPHAFAVPEHKMGGAYNYFSYVLIDKVFWTATASQINRWRRKMLGLPMTNLDKLQQNKVPFMYNFSPHVVVPPLDYSEWVRITGYWFLDTGSKDFQPPEDLVNFINQAREDGKKIVYVGFGSVTVGDSVSMTKTIIEAIQRAGVRCILSKGWSDRMHKMDEVPMPPEIHQIKSCPHDWLFKQVDVAVHHGGAGTTGASLRAGIPTIIKPFFGDQFFFGTRIEDLGVGICLKKLTTNGFARALIEATHNERMVQKAKILGQEIRGEDGVQTAVQTIYRYLDYARTRTLLKKPNAEMPEESEESWTFVGDDTDLSQSKQIPK